MRSDGTLNRMSRGVPFFHRSILLAAADPTSLENLYDIVIPPPVPWWPPAPGWYVVGGVLLALACWGAWWVWRRWRAAAYRRAALAEWRQLKTQANDSSHREAALRHLQELVKRVALAAFPREAVASLSGDEWLRFLDRSGHTDAFTRGPGQLLPALAYDPKLVAQFDTRTVDDLFRIVQRWICDHTAVLDTQMFVTPSTPVFSTSADRERKPAENIIEKARDMEEHPAAYGPPHLRPPPC